MDEKEQTCMEIAKSRNGFYGHGKSAIIYVQINSASSRCLEKYRMLFGIGRVYDEINDYGSRPQSLSSESRGQYAWRFKDLEAYQFCQDMLPWLRRYDPVKYYYCKQCIEAYESRRHEQTTQPDPT